MSENPNAFPTNDITPYHPGMTLRDWFAGQALTGLTASDNWGSVMSMARYAYELADAMLAERAK